jgi:hypothetical protein
MNLRRNQWGFCTRATSIDESSNKALSKGTHIHIFTIGPASSEQFLKQLGTRRFSICRALLALRLYI